MGDCGVCIDMDYDGDPADLFSEREVTARKPHKCCECNETIPTGARYAKATGRWDGRFDEFKTCLPCLEIRRMATCGGSFVFSLLWEEIREVMFPQGTLAGCLSRLETAAAREKLAAEWRAWKEID